jgi:hypothetical protein
VLCLMCERASFRELGSALEVKWHPTSRVLRFDKDRAERKFRRAFVELNIFSSAVN